MNDFSSTQNSPGLLKSYYDPDDATMQALSRRQARLEQKVKSQNPNPKVDDVQDDHDYR